MPKSNLKKTAKVFIEEAIQAVNPYRLVLERVQLNGSLLQVGNVKLDLESFEHIYVLGAGKAAASMAAALEIILGPRLQAGRIIVKYGHTKPLHKIEQYEAGHPVPDQAGLDGSRAVLELAKQATKNDLILFVLSGGASALFEYLPDSLSLADLAAFNQQLLTSGAAINEMNLLRKKISLVKGGGFLTFAQPARVVSLILSDVIGDPLQDIASGPTVVSRISNEAVDKIVKKYGLLTSVPDSIQKILLTDSAENTVKKTYFEKNVFNQIIGNNLIALKKIKEEAEIAGFHSMILSDCVQGEARDVAKMLGAILKSALRNGMPLQSPACLIAGGEPTVTLKKHGKGGRNQELVLAALTVLKDEQKPFYFCSIGSDGTDGPTDAAGAWIDQNSFNKAKQFNLDADTYLQNHDAYHFFREMNQLIRTGPTGTNVMDLMFCLF